MDNLFVVLASFTNKPSGILSAVNCYTRVISVSCLFICASTEMQVYIYLMELELILLKSI
jgi:hypothetical protein